MKAGEEEVAETKSRAQAVGACGRASADCAALGIGCWRILLLGHDFCRTQPAC